MVLIVDINFPLYLQEQSLGVLSPEKLLVLLRGWGRLEPKGLLRRNLNFLAVFFHVNWEAARHGKSQEMRFLVNPLLNILSPCACYNSKLYHKMTPHAQLLDENPIRAVAHRPVQYRRRALPRFLFPLQTLWTTEVGTGANSRIDFKRNLPDSFRKVEKALK